MAKTHIPRKIEINVSDPYVKYLVNMYNNGVDYLTQAEQIITTIDDYQSKLNDYMKNTKLVFLLGGKK